MSVLVIIAQEFYSELSRRQVGHCIAVIRIRIRMDRIDLIGLIQIWIFTGNADPEPGGQKIPQN
jgi:hypothetical protein